MRRVVAIIGTPSLLDSVVCEGLEELISTDRVWFGQSDEWRAHNGVYRAVRDHIARRDETVRGPLSVAELLDGATDLWAIWNGNSIECRETIAVASYRGIRIRIEVMSRGRCTREKAEREVDGGSHV